MQPTWRERDLLQLRLDLLNVLADRLRDDREVLMQRAVGWAGARGLLGSHGAVAEAAQLGAARPVAQAAGLLALGSSKDPAYLSVKFPWVRSRSWHAPNPTCQLFNSQLRTHPLVMLPRLRIRPHGMQQTPKHLPTVNKPPMHPHLLVMLPRLRIKSARRAHIWSATLPPARTLRRWATFSLQGEGMECRAAAFSDCGKQMECRAAEFSDWDQRRCTRKQRHLTQGPRCTETLVASFQLALAHSHVHYRRHFAGVRLGHNTTCWA